MNTRIGFVLLLMALAPLAASGAVLFDAPSLTGAPGETLLFAGAIVNDWGANVFLTGASLTLAGFDPADTDILPFLLNAPLTLATESSTISFGWFTVTIPLGFAPGSYPGDFTIQGGAEEGADGWLDSAGFEVVVQGGGGAEVPEPGAVALTGLGLLALSAAIRRRR